MNSRPDHRAETADTIAADAAPPRITPVGIIFAAAGLTLFAYFVWKAGPLQIWGNIGRLGWGFLVVLLISSVRPALRAFAWTRCFEAPHHLRWRDALRAYLAGDALGNLMPLGIVVSEPAKAAFVRERVPLVAGGSALAVENLFYVLSVALFVFAGTGAMLLSFPLSAKLRVVSGAILVGGIAVVALVYVALWQQWKLLSRVLALLASVGVGRASLAQRQVSVASLEDRVYGFYARNRSRFLPIMLTEAGFHLAGVVEVYATLYFISDVPPTWLAAFVLESVNRVINVVFKFVPMRVGVDEAGTGLFTSVLRFGTATGVTLAIVRKARVVVWTAIGVAVLVRRGLSVRAVAREAQAAAKEVEVERRRAQGDVEERIEEAGA